MLQLLFKKIVILLNPRFKENIFAHKYCRYDLGTVVQFVSSHKMCARAKRSKKYEQKFIFDFDCKWQRR